MSSLLVEKSRDRRWSDILQHLPTLDSWLSSTESRRLGYQHHSTSLPIVAVMEDPELSYEQERELNIR